MEIPQTLRDALEHQLIGIQQMQMIHDAQTISMRYRTESGKGKRLLTHDNEAIAYAVSRMPATYGAVCDALEQVLASSNCRPQTLLDVGAGTGAVAWAADSILDLKSVLCLEREDAMRRLGELMMKNGSQVLREAKWICYDLNQDKIPDKADLVVASYVLNEMNDIDRMNTIKKLWDATKMVLLLVEPGTPIGFSHLKEARQTLLEFGAHIAAPCPHEANCPITPDDWCHFTCRVNRSRLHRQLKGGEAPFEDEKYSYIALTREKNSNSGARVLRHPQIYSGYITFDACTEEGIQHIKLSKKDGEKYKRARKVKAGDKL